MPIPPFQGEEDLNIDWLNFNPSLPEIAEAARNVDPVELPPVDEVLRALMHVPPGQSDVAIEDWVFPNQAVYEQLLEDQLTDLQTSEQRTPRRWPSSHGRRTPTALINGGIEAEESTISSRTAEPRGTVLSQQHLDALSDYEATLSLLYDATLNASQPRTETTVSDPSMRWLLVYSLMASFSSLHPSLVAQSTRSPHRSTFQDVVWELWLVVQRGDREAVRRLDQALRGRSSRDF